MGISCPLQVADSYSWKVCSIVVVTYPTLSSCCAKSFHYSFLHSSLETGCVCTYMYKEKPSWCCLGVPDPALCSKLAEKCSS